MQRLKPTLVIALDPHAAAFCAAVGPRLGRGPGTRGALTRVCALVESGGRFRFEEKLEQVAAADFARRPEGDGSGDSSAAPSPSGTTGAQPAASSDSANGDERDPAALFEADADAIETALAEMLKHGHSYEERQRALSEQYQIADERVIYLVLSAHDRAARGVVLELARLVRFLCSRRFVDEPFTLHSVVLLPDLFTRPGGADYAGAYALLKRLDDAALNGIGAGSRHPIVPFDTCWLLDGRNAEGFFLGTLDEQLPSYADALAGFLSSEPERSGALLGTRTSRGRPPAYNSFGYGELFFPAETAVWRLTSALARDVITRAYLPAASTDARDDRAARRLLLAAKKIVLGKGYTDALEGLELVKDGQLFRPSLQRTELQETRAVEYSAELRRRHAEFERKDLIELRQRLEASRDDVAAKLTELLDQEIDERADGSPAGLIEALDFVTVLTDTGVALQEDVLGEKPQNLITEFRAGASRLDRQLQVEADASETAALLERAHHLRGHLDSLRTSLRIAHPPTADAPARADSGGATVETKDAATADDADAPLDLGDAARGDGDASPSREDERRALEAEIAEAEEQLAALKTEYPRAADREERAAAAARREAARRVEQERAEAVERAENEFITAADGLRIARVYLDELKLERRQLLRRLLVLYPSLAAAVGVGVPALAALGDLGPSRALLELVWDNLWTCLLWLSLAALVYLALVFLVFTRDINRRIREAAERVEAQARDFEASAARLRSARNSQLLFEYEQSAQKARNDLFYQLIQTARSRADDLRRALDALAGLREEFGAEHAAARPPSSITRRPLLTADDIDAYYARAFNPDAEARRFASEKWVPRSRVRSTPPSDLRARLVEFGRGVFRGLEELSVEDVLLRKPDLLPPAAALDRLRDLRRAAEPLLRLRERDASAETFAERDVTLWAGGDERDQILTLFHRVAPRATVNASDDKRALRVLTRCLNFPAYFLGPVEHYRACYDRLPAAARDAAQYPDPLPADAGLKEVQEQLLTAIAAGVVTPRADGAGYAFASTGQALPGTTRRETVERLNTYAARKLYEELKARVAAASSDRAALHRSLISYLAAAPDLDQTERETLEELAERWHPLG